MALTWNDIIYLALRKCGQLRAGAGANSDLMNDGLLELQAICDSWAADRTMNPTIPNYIYPITGPGSAAIESGQVLGMGYTIGPTGADFTGPRPTAIVRANLLLTSSSAMPVRVPLTPLCAEEWAAIDVLQLPPTNIASAIYYEPTFPNGICWLWPPVNGNSLELFTWGFSIAPVQLDQAFNFAPGYQDAFVYELAARIWGLCDKSMMINKTPREVLTGQASRAKMLVRRINSAQKTMGSDFHSGSGGLGNFDRLVTYTGEPY